MIHPHSSNAIEALRQWRKASIICNKAISMIESLLPAFRNGIDDVLQAQCAL